MHGHGVLWRLLGRRLSQAVLLLFLVSVLTFLLVALIPGDPAANILGGGSTPEVYRALDHQLGFDRPIWVQYGSWLGRVLHGSLGTSLTSSQPVSAILNSAVGVTLPLVLLTIVVSAGCGIGLGVASATRRGVVAAGTDVLAMVGLAVPNFWAALVLVQFFGVDHRWLPATGYVPFGQSPWEWLRSLILPVVTLSIAGVAGIAKQTRACVDEALRRDFVDSLWAAGLSRRRILYRHVLKNAAIPITSTIGTSLVGILGGTVIVENVFALPGLGRAAVSATTSHDLPVLVGAAVYFCVAVILINLLADLAYGRLDPKVRVG